MIEANYLNSKAGEYLFSAVLLAWLVAFMPTIYTIVSEWDTGEAYTHGPLTVLMAAWFFRDNKKSFANVCFANVWGYVLFGVFFGALWLIASIADVLLIEQLSAYFVLISAFAMLYGWRVLWEVRLGLFFLLLSLPVWGFLQLPLREVSAIVAVNAIEWIGIPLFYDNFKVSVPGGSFYIAPACSGLGFFLVSLILGCFYTYLNGLKGREAWLFVGYALALAVISNCLRIIIIIAVGSVTDMEHPIVQDHLTFGWILYAFMLIPLFWVGEKFFSSSGEGI